MRYEPLLVKIRMRTPFLLGYPWIHSDGILSHLNREAEEEDFYNLPSKYVVPPQAEENHIAWVYGAGEQTPFPLASVYIPRHVHHATLYKRFETAHIDLLSARKKYIDIAKGSTRNWALPFLLCYDPIIEFRVCALRGWLEKRLHHLTHIGKKHVAGYGEVRSIEIQTLPSSRDVLLDAQGKLTRQIPVWAVEGVISHESMFWGVPRPPYWDKGLVQLCVRPGEQVRLSEMVEGQLAAYDVGT